MSGTPWNDFGLIAYISQKVSDLGKTKLQKLVYLIKEVEKIPLNFTYRFYNYGPYSDKLAETLDIVNSLNGICMTYDNHVNTYDIKPGSNAQLLIEKAMSSIGSYKESIDSVLEQYGRNTARELELISTIIYIDRNYHEADEKGLARKAQELKPKFTLTEISVGIEQLKDNGLVLQ